MARFNESPAEYIGGTRAQRCCVCREVQHLSAFHNAPDKKLGVTSTCKPCTKRRGQVWRAANSEKDKAAKRLYHRLHPDQKKQSGWREKGIDITPATYAVMFEHQAGKCAICEQHQSAFKRKFAVDHNHATGKVRGLLCGNCNAGIGLFKEDPTRVRTAIEYLRRHNEQRDKSATYTTAGFDIF